MKIVFDPKLKEVVTIDETKEKDRQKKYYHRSGVPFDWVEQSLQVDYSDLTNEKLCELVEEKTWKPVATPYKSRREWLLGKLA